LEKRVQGFQGSRIQTESAKEQNTMKMTDNTTASKTDKIYRIPPIDAAAPVETETATFALG
jgi:hypothetical protein